MTVITETKVHIGDLHFELNLWLNEFKFYKNEITIFTHRLEEIVSKNITDMEIMKEVEHFQNQYVRQTEVNDELRHEIKQHENALEKEEKISPIAMDHTLFDHHRNLRDQVSQFKKIYAELRSESMDFLSKWM